MKRKNYDSLVPSREITPPEVFFDRRRFVALAAVGTAGLSLGRIAAAAPSDEAKILTPPLSRPEVFPAARNKAYAIPESIERKDLTPRLAAATHNNYYEFLPGRGGPAWQYVDDFEVEPWKLEVSGHCNKPQTFDLDDLFAFEQEERLYHFRCVERWAMNVPWSGFPLKRLLDAVEPNSKAAFVRFETANRPDQMPGIKQAGYYPWPYHEGLRIAEAYNELAFMATGVYGEPLLKQHGAPVRLVVPWKYGYKNPKSIVKIELVSTQPRTFWQVQEHEYGFLSNINPNIPHPRWSQTLSYWLDRSNEGFPTPLFNGYAEQVASLYPDEPMTPQRPLTPGETAR